MLVPATKVFLLNRIKYQGAMRKEYISIDLSPFLLSNFRNCVRGWVDLDLLRRLHPVILLVLDLSKQTKQSLNKRLPHSKAEFLQLLE